jgi:hypothetical protein
MVRKVDALLSFHFHIAHPEELPDELWSEKWKQLQFALWFEAERHSGEKKQLSL